MKSETDSILGTERKKLYPFWEEGAGWKNICDCYLFVTE